MRSGVWVPFLVTMASCYGNVCTYDSANGTALEMAEVNKRIELYSLKLDQPPATLAEVYGDKETPTDAWGNAFVLEVPGPDGVAYDLVSYGSDGVPGGTGRAEDLRWSAMR